MHLRIVIFVSSLIWATSSAYPLCTGCDFHGNYYNYYYSNYCCDYSWYGWYGCGSYSNICPPLEIDRGPKKGKNENCPVIKDCREVVTNYMTECNNDNDCSRNTKCCTLVCDGRQYCQNLSASEAACPNISSCPRFQKNYPNLETCTNDGDCKRDEKCCSIPCSYAFGYHCLRIS